MGRETAPVGNPKQNFVARRLSSAWRFVRDRMGVRRIVPACRFVSDRLFARPLRFAGGFLRQGLVVRPLLVAMLIIGGVLTFLGVQEYRLTNSVTAQPQQITCGELSAKGPGDNLYVRMTDFEFTDYYVHFEPNRGAPWQTAFVPAVPPRAKDSPSVRTVRVLVRTSDARNARSLYAMTSAPLEGVLVQGISSLAAEEQERLRKSYGGGIDLEKCWVLETGKRPMGAAPTLGMIGGGTGLAVIAAGMLLLAGRRG